MIKDPRSSRRDTHTLDDRGFTLAELIFAAVIMFIVAMGTLTALEFSAASTQASTVRDAALDIANRQVEYTRNLDYDDVGVPGAEPPGVIVSPDATTTPQGSFTITTTVTWIRDVSSGRAEFKRVKVDVSWTTGTPGVVSVSTDVFGKSNLVNTGDLLFTTLKKDDNSPLQNTRVTIQPSTGGSRTVYSDSSGNAFFGFVPAGAVTISVSNGGYLFDATQYTGSSITPDLLNSIVAYGQMPSSANVHVVGNPSGGNLSGALVRLTDASSNAVSAYTDTSGIAHFDNLLIGIFSIRVTYPGRTTVSGQTLSVTAGGQTVAQTVQMTDPADLLVRAVDGSSNRISGATVTVTGPSPSSSNATGSPALTASNGEISFAQLLDGSYTVLVQKSGYADSSSSVTLAGIAVTKIVTLTPNGPGSLLVTVKKSNGTAVSGVYIRFYTPYNGSNYTQYTTNSSGQVSLSSISPGNYGVTWRNSSYVYSSQLPVTISTGVQSLLNITYQ